MVDIPNNAKTLDDDERRALITYAKDVLRKKSAFRNVEEAFIDGFLTGVMYVRQDIGRFIDIYSEDDGDA